MDGWRDGWMDGWRDGWTDGWTDGWADWMVGWLAVWADGWMDGWTDGRMDGWMDGWIDFMGGWDVLALGGSELSRLPELFESDYEWSQKGRALFKPPQQRVVIELFDKESPMACANFKAFCTGEKGKSKESGKERDRGTQDEGRGEMCYRNVPFHRVIKGFMMQGGDFVTGTGAGGESIYGKKFKDDAGGLKLKHDARGIVSMSNTGKNSNTCQFFITFGEQKQLNGKHVVIGRVVEGMEVIDRMEAEAGTEKEERLDGISLSSLWSSWTAVSSPEPPWKRSRSLDERAQLVNLWLDEVPPVRWLADKLGIQPLAVAFAGVFWMVLFALWGFMGELVCKVVGNLYPMYASFRALEDGDHQQVSSWLTYWVSFAALTLLEGVWCRFMAWLPFYYVLRLALIVWLFLPVTCGAQVLYNWLVAPVLRRHRAALDAQLDRSALRLRGGLSQRLREAFKGQSAESAERQSMEDELGWLRSPDPWEDLMALELAKAAARRFVGSGAEATEVPAAPVSTRARTASPRPSPVPSRKHDALQDPLREEAFGVK
eukprot:s681_g3.t1